MKFRSLNKLYADLKGYFWLPCPSCGQMFGGHEWKNGQFNSIPEDSEGRTSEGICPDCQKQWEETGVLSI